MARLPLARIASLARTRLRSLGSRVTAAGLVALGLVAAAPFASGCAAAWPVLRELSRPDRTIVSPPGEDGTQYLAVEGGPLASPAGLRSRFSVVARQVCEGEYLELMEPTTTSRRSGGVTRSRMHEGYIRCLLPGEREPGPGATAGPTVADAETKPSPPRRARRANLARQSWTR